MNLHVLQNPVATSEAKQIMAVPHQIISPKDSVPVIEPVQDSVIGSYLLTRKDTFLTKSRFFDLTMVVKYGDRPVPKPAILFKGPGGKWDGLFTGKQLATYYMPKGITLQRAVRGLEAPGLGACMDPDERYVYVHDGNVLVGQLCKRTIGGVSRGIVHRTVHAHGSWRAAKLISDLQRVATHWIANHGFSIGLEDCVHTQSTQNDIDGIIQSAFHRIETGTAAARENGISELDIESECQNLLSSVLNTVASGVLTTLDPRNNIRMCVESGSKGKKLNICQIHGCIGQQVVSGSRVRQRKDFGARTFPCYEKGDEDPVAFGFCPTSYMQGLDPVAYYTHSQGGREGMIDTACKTAETGYIQRRLITILQSEKAHFDGTVRDSNAGIVMFRYGGDRMDAEKLLKVRVGAMTLAGDPIAVATRWCGVPGMEATRLAEVIKVARCAIDVFSKKTIQYVHLPFDVNDMIRAEDEGEYLIPMDVVNALKRVEGELFEIVGDKLSCNHFLVSLRSTIVSRRLRGRTLSEVQAALDRCVQLTRMACVEGGTMVGTIAAQSIGEPATQMVSHFLSSFFSQPLFAKINKTTQLTTQPLRADAQYFPLGRYWQSDRHAGRPALQRVH